MVGKLKCFRKGEEATLPLASQSFSSDLVFLSFLVSFQITGVALNHAMLISCSIILA